MEHNINDTRLQVYFSMSHSKQYLYDAIGFSMLALNLATKFNVDDNLLDKIQLTIGDIILGFYKIEDTVPLLQQELGLDAKTAALLGADVLDFLAPLSDPNWKPPIEEGDSDVESTPQPDRAIVDSYVPTIHESESVMNSSVIPELRTMAADMVEVRSPVRSTFNAAASLSDEPVYSSTQPTIVRPATEAPSYSAPLYQPPKPNVDAPLEKPRWG